MVRAALLLRPRELKARRVDELKELLKKFSVVAIVDLYRSSADLMHLFRHNFRGQTVIKAAKKTLIIKAAREVGRTGIADYLEKHKQPVALIFTNMNPFIIKLELDKARVLTPPKPNEHADIDVVVPPINTGLQPGPILSEFGKLKIPTRIEGGMIWIARETTVARKGETIQPALASLLSKLDIGAVYRSINILAAFDRDLLIPSDLLSIDIEETRNMLSQAHSTSIALATAVGYTTPETIIPILVKAHFSAVSLSTFTGYPEKDTISGILARAEAQATALSKLIETRSAS
ncbi:MAG: 50S ribosomal protein L10 [Nitrososphaerota archaeon]|nr:50S ribosomal protein L10 [Candidatus Calditenuaceae archaeon]MDW8072921.1 50S ribosomal protein L10 [Nitrososphaerota archaeon]